LQEYHYVEPDAAFVPEKDDLLTPRDSFVFNNMVETLKKKYLK